MTKTKTRWRRKRMIGMWMGKKEDYDRGRKYSGGAGLRGKIRRGEVRDIKPKSRKTQREEEEEDEEDKRGDMSEEKEQT